MSQNKKKCFVITPIGEDNTEIRRHIDGIIDQSIEPALKDKYTVEVSHRKYEIGSINEKIIRSIYESDLVIANLTTLNPNVMFELAIRYSFGKPAIVIAEKGTKLPFDIIDENTIFYINDPTGSAKLSNDIKMYEEKIDLIKDDYGPVYKAIEKIAIYKAVEKGKDVSNEEMLNYIVNRLDVIEKGIKLQKKFEQQFTEHSGKSEEVNMRVNGNLWNNEKFVSEFEKMLLTIPNVEEYMMKDDTLTLVFASPISRRAEERIVDEIFSWIQAYKNIA